jgi:hypothetical protein
VANLCLLSRTATRESETKPSAKPNVDNNASISTWPVQERARFPCFDNSALTPRAELQRNCPNRVLLREKCTLAAYGTSVGTNGLDKTRICGARVRISSPTMLLEPSRSYIFCRKKASIAHVNHDTATNPTHGLAYKLADDRNLCSFKCGYARRKYSVQITRYRILHIEA